MDHRYPGALQQVRDEMEPQRRRGRCAIGNVNERTPKPRGQSAGKPLSERTRFKLMWRDSMSEAARDFLAFALCSADTQASIRAGVAMKLKINLTRDEQIAGDARLGLRAAGFGFGAERRADVCSASPTSILDWTKDQQREALLKRIYNWGRSLRRFCAGPRKPCWPTRNWRRFQFDKEKFRKVCARNRKPAALPAALHNIQGQRGSEQPTTRSKPRFRKRRNDFRI